MGISKHASNVFSVFIQVRYQNTLLIEQDYLAQSLRYSNIIANTVGYADQCFSYCLFIDNPATRWSVSTGHGIINYLLIAR